MLDMFRIIGQLSRSPISVLVNGKFDINKELLANIPDRYSQHTKVPFIAFNMATIPKDLIKPELFGHEKEIYRRKPNLSELLQTG